MAVETRRKATFATITAASSMQGQPSMTVSTVNPDRMGDRVLPEGAQLEHFLRAPTMTWGHDYSAIPIGTVTHLDIVPGAGIRASWRWLADDPFADRVRNAYEQGIVRASSIGFRPLRTKPNSTGGDDILEWELLEIALVAVPANPEAVRRLKALGLHADADPVLCRLIDDSNADPTYSVNPDDLRDALKRLLPEIVRAAVRRQAEEALKRAIEKARGRVPDRVNGAALVGLAEPTKARGIRR